MGAIGRSTLRGAFTQSELPRTRFPHFGALRPVTRSNSHALHAMAEVCFRKVKGYEREAKEKEENGPGPLSEWKKFLDNPGPILAVGSGTPDRQNVRWPVGRDPFA
jgi:hypothetical protein